MSDKKLTLDEAQQAIHAQLVKLCEGLGEDASDLGFDESIPGSGLVDSAALLELLAWYESFFGIELAPAEITIDNLGTVARMARFALARQAGG